jgi:hypothetical protein
MIYGLRVVSILFAALALVPAGAHLFSMVSKMRLTGTGYLISQRAYDGWNMFAIVVIGALVATLTLTIALYRSGEPYLSAGLAFLCIVATQASFWSFTYPANTATENWTVLPDRWEALRIQWEYSHAGSAMLNAAALLLLVFSSTKG